MPPTDSIRRVGMEVSAELLNQLECPPVPISKSMRQFVSLNPILLRQRWMSYSLKR